MRFIYLALFLILTSNANADVKWKVLDYDEKKEYFVVSALDSLHFAYSYKRTTEHPFKMQNFIMMTEDGGKTWEERWTYNWNPTETVKIYDVGYIEYLNKDTILAGCTEGLILRSTDGGRNWDSTFLESDNAISSLNFYNSKNGVVKNHNDYMYLTDDAGYSYVKISLPDSLLNDSFGFWNGYRISEKKIIFLCGGFHYPPGEHREDAYFKVVKTEDNGKTWQSSDSLYTRVQYLNIINDSTYFAAGNTNGVDWRPVILKSNDWGMNWEKIWVDSTAYNSMGGARMAVISEQEMVGCTSNRIFRTSDGGYTWIEEDYEKASLYPKFRSIAIAGNKGYITEKYGTLLEYSPTTGIKEFSSTNQNLLVYPNPVISGSEVNFKLDREIPGEVNFEILDINGNTIDKNTLTALPENKACSFDTSDLSSGTYFIKITSAKDSWSSKFSVVR